MTDPTTVSTHDDQRREARARRALRNFGSPGYGYSLRKSRIRNPHLDNQGGYMIVDDQTNGAVAGMRYDLTLDDVEQWLREEPTA